MNELQSGLKKSDWAQRMEHSEERRRELIGIPIPLDNIHCLLHKIMYDYDPDNNNPK